MATTMSMSIPNTTCYRKRYIRVHSIYVDLRVSESSLRCVSRIVEPRLAPANSVRRAPTALRWVTDLYAL